MNRNHPKDMMQLYSMYENRNVKTELKYMSERLASGYLTRDEADFLRWLCHAALKRIKELE